MPTQTCPRCSAQGQWLEHSSQGPHVDYYRCDCGHVWTVSKRDHVRRDVTYSASQSNETPEFGDDPSGDDVERS